MNGKWKISSDPQKIRFITIIIVALGGLLWYFRPLSLSNLANDSIQILATEIEYVVKDDMAYHNVTNYTEISDVQKNEIQALFENYSYKRTLGTLFSDGSLDGFFNKVPHKTVLISVYKEGDSFNSITIRDTGKIAVNDKDYKIQDSAELIEAMLEIISN